MATPYVSRKGKRAARRADRRAGRGGWKKRRPLCNGVLRHEVARLIVWHAVSTRPVVPSTVSYVVRQQGNALSNAHGHSTHRHPTGTRTARRRCICQHQAEMGLDGWYGEHMLTLGKRRDTGQAKGAE